MHVIGTSSNSGSAVWAMDEVGPNLVVVVYIPDIIDMGTTVSLVNG